jgi:hypothetical protein
MVKVPSRWQQHWWVTGATANSVRDDPEGVVEAFGAPFPSPPEPLLVRGSR